MPFLELTHCFHGFEAQQKMPCGHGNTSGNIEKVADSRNCILSKRSLNQNNYKFSPKDGQVSALVLRNSEERCLIFTLVTLGLDPPLKFLVPFLLNVQGSDCRNHLGSGTHLNVGGLDSLSTQPATNNSPENTGASKSFSARSSGQNTLGHSRSRNKRTKSIRSSSASSINCPVSDISSCSVSDGLSALHPDFLIPDSPKVEKPSVKKSSRKKGKKKRKQYKQSLCQKVSIESCIPCEEGISDASVYDASMKSDLAGSSEHVSGDNLPVNATLSNLSIKDIVMEKDDGSVSSNGSIQSVAGSMTCMSYTAEMDVSDPIASSQGSASEESGCNRLSMDEISTDLSSTLCNVSQEIILPTSDVNTMNSHAKQESFSCGISFGNSLDQSTCTVVDSLLDDWNSDLIEVVSDDIETLSSIKDESGFNSSEIGVDCRINSTASHRVIPDSCDIDSETSSGYWLSSPVALDRSNQIINTNNSTERVQCSNQASSSDGFHTVVYRRRSKLLRKMTGSSNAGNIHGSANILGQTGKDIRYPVWQKVHKSGIEERNHDLKTPRVSKNNSSRGPDSRAKLNAFMDLQQSSREKSIVPPCSEGMVVQAELQTAASNGLDSNELSSKSNDIKCKAISVLKQSNHYSKKGCHTDKKNIARPSKIQIQQKDESEISPQVNHYKCIRDGLKSVCNTTFQGLVDTPTIKPVCRQSEQKQKKQTHMESTPLGNGCSTVCDMTSLAQSEVSRMADDDHTKMLPILDFLDNTDSSIIQQYDNMHVDCHPNDFEDYGSMKSETESSNAADSKSSNCSGSLMQRWIPVRRKEPMANESDEAEYDNSNSKNVEADALSSNPHQSVLFFVGSSESSSLSSEDPDHRLEADELSSEFRSLPHNEKFADVLAVSNCHFTHEVKHRCRFQAEDHLDLIVKAVADAYESQLASENICLITGSPIAEFEKLIHSASPVLGQIGCLSCEACPQGQIGNSLCLHQIPNFSLTSLWHWFERPGSYGLEVKVEDCSNSNMLRNGHFEFRAYFVPYLSAMQLFGWAKSSLCCGDGSLNGELTDAVEVGSSSSANTDLCDQSFAKHLGDGELLFEYFESNQPQQRRPLYEQIKELVRGDVASGKMFGDPLNLECLNLHDLHPASWYSVAWYPIYRIPNGIFRAAFLTYHSLGHFAYRKTSSNGAACLVSPVVGLQSYNAKGECWFQPQDLKSPVVQTEAALTSTPSHILKERLRILEQTASVMATASVWKGNQRSLNRQPDYEFFISRRR